MPGPGDLTTDRVLNEAQRDLDQLTAEVDELIGLVDGVLYRFPKCGGAMGLGAGDWPPSAA